MWAVAAQQLRDPMNIMLIAVVAVRFVIGEVSTGVIVGLLILLNVRGSHQELKARASIDALANLQVPQARVVRDGSVALVPAIDVVPGDIVDVEAGVGFVLPSAADSSLAHEAPSLFRPLECCRPEVRSRRSSSSTPAFATTR